jgi:hypothetical protein
MVSEFRGPSTLQGRRAGQAGRGRLGPRTELHQLYARIDARRSGPNRPAALLPIVPPPPSRPLQLANGQTRVPRMPPGPVRPASGLQGATSSLSPRPGPAGRGRLRRLEQRPAVVVAAASAAVRGASRRHMPPSSPHSLQPALQPSPPSANIRVRCCGGGTVTAGPAMRPPDPILGPA